MSDPLRFVVLGQGRAGSARIRAIEAHPGAELAGVLHQADHADPERLGAALRALASDVAVVCTPNSLHVPQCEVALQEGLHVRQHLLWRGDSPAGRVDFAYLVLFHE